MKKNKRANVNSYRVARLQHGSACESVYTVRSETQLFPAQTD